MPDDVLAEALSAAGVGIWTWDLVTDAKTWSRDLFRLFGLPEDGPAPEFEAYVQLVHPDDRAFVGSSLSGAIAEATRTGRPANTVGEYRVLTPTGVRWVESRAHVQVGPDGKASFVMGVDLDVTARKEATEAADRAREVENLFAELASDYVYRVDVTKPALVPVVMAGSFERTTGMTLGELEERGGWLAVLHPDDRGKLESSFPNLLAGRPTVSEYRVVTRSGSVRWLRDLVRPVVNDEGVVTYFWGGVQDITERKRLEDELVHARKQEALARLAGAVAHDFNNLLGVVAMSLDVLERRGALSAPAREPVQTARSAVERAADLTRSLLIFGRRDAGTPKVVDLNDVVRAALPVIGRAVKDRVTLVTDLADEPLVVRIDPGQAQLVLLNLAVNADDAMARGGTLTLRTRRAARTPEDDAPQVELFVEDEGTGIAAEVMGHLFEPFVTTKAAGRGTGLGLASCHGVVTRAGGTIRAENRAPRGATFRIALPRASEAPEAVARPDVRSTVGGTETILVVEDNVNVRELTVRLLHDLGYTARGAVSAEHAVETDLADVDLVLTDVGLPGRSGIELALLLRERERPPAIVLMSGQAPPESVPAGLELLAKPFSIDDLAAALRRNLDARRR